VYRPLGPGDDWKGGEWRRIYHTSRRLETCVETDGNQKKTERKGGEKKKERSKARSTLAAHVSLV